MTCILVNKFSFPDICTWRMEFMYQIPVSEELNLCAKCLCQGNWTLYQMHMSRELKLCTEWLCQGHQLSAKAIRMSVSGPSNVYVKASKCLSGPSNACQGNLTSVPNILDRGNWTFCRQCMLRLSRITSENQDFYLTCVKTVMPWALNMCPDLRCVSWR